MSDGQAQGAQVQATQGAPQAATTKQCDFCKEQVRPEALLCKHCGSRLQPDKPEHGGTCPYCKETIDPSAMKCKHCKSMLTESGDSNGCGCGCTGGSVSGYGRPISVPRIGGGGPWSGGWYGGIGGGIITDPGHDCYGACTDGYVACMSAGGGAACRAAFDACKRACPAPGPQWG